MKNTGYKRGKPKDYSALMEPKANIPIMESQLWVKLMELLYRFLLLFIKTKPRKTDRTHM